MNVDSLLADESSTGVLRALTDHQNTVRDLVRTADPTMRTASESIEIRKTRLRELAKSTPEIAEFFGLEAAPSEDRETE